MSMKKQTIATMACSVLALGACGGQNGSSSIANPYKVYCAGMNAEFVPFELQTSGGSVEGFDVDLMNATVKAGNFKVEFKHQPRESLFPSLGNGDVDIVASDVIITDECKQSMDLSDPYFEITRVVLVPRGRKAASSDDLKSMARAGVVIGQAGDFSISKLLGSNNPKISRFETVPLITKELENGGLDSVVSDNTVIASYVRNNPAKGLNSITLPDFSVENYGIAVRKGDETAVRVLSDALKKVREDGEYDKIYAKYFAKEEAKAGKAEKTK